MITVGQPQRRLYVTILKQSAALLGSCARGWIAYRYIGSSKVPPVLAAPSARPRNQDE